MTSYQAQLRHCVEQEVPGRLPAVVRGGRESRSVRAREVSNDERRYSERTGPSEEGAAGVYSSVADPNCWKTGGHHTNGT